MRSSRVLMLVVLVVVAVELAGCGASSMKEVGNQPGPWELGVQFSGQAPNLPDGVTPRLCRLTMKFADRPAEMVAEVWEGSGSFQTERGIGGIRPGEYVVLVEFRYVDDGTVITRRAPSFAADNEGYFTSGGYHITYLNVTLY